MPFPIPGRESAADMVMLDCNRARVAVSKQSAQTGGATYVHNPVLWVVGIGTAHVEPTVLAANRLNHTDMIAAIETLQSTSQ